MRNRIAQFILAELIAFGSLCFAGLAFLGAAVTWNGDSQHPAAVSWTFVAGFTLIALALGRTAVVRFARAWRPSETA